MQQDGNMQPGMPYQAEQFKGQEAAAPGWSSGLYDCFDDMQVCWYGYRCGPCLYGSMVNRLNGGGSTGPCLMYTFCHCFACIFAAKTRRQIRDKYGLPEEPCADWMVYAFAPCCALCQQERELKKRGV